VKGGGTDDMLKQIVWEVTILQKLRGSKACVQFHDDIGWDTHTQRLFLYMDFCNGGSLEDAIKKATEARYRHRVQTFQTEANSCSFYRTTFTEDEVKGILEDIIEALRSCERFKIIHRDIKPANSKCPDEDDACS